MTDALRPIVGVGVMIMKDGKVLLGRRKSSHGTGEYAFPSVAVNNLESFEDCAVRAAKQECELEIQNPQFQYLANIVHYAPVHYVFVGMTAEWKSGEPHTLPKGSCVGWEWFDLDKLPRLVFKNVELAIESQKSGESYFGVIE